jgi:hypothetical protein
MGIFQEVLIPLATAARRLPCRRSGRPTHVSTLHRWRSKGLKGVRLESVRVGSIWHTSAEAVERFVGQLSGPDSNAVQQAGTGGNKTPASGCVRVEEQLDAMGI